MSDSIVRVIPSDPFVMIPSILLEKVSIYLKKHINCDSVSFKEYEHPEFIDCGGNLDIITFPLCGTIISFDWWRKAMNNAYNSLFTDLKTITPCCNKSTTLNDLNYSFKCGFAKCSIEIHNPSNIDNVIIQEVQEILGTAITIIYAHY